MLKKFKFFNIDLMKCIKKNEFLYISFIQISLINEQIY